MPDLHRTIVPLRLVFWGGLLYFFDLTIAVTDINWQFDIFSDLAGAMLVTYGVWSLARLGPHRRYRRSMLFVSSVAALTCVGAIGRHFSYEAPFLFSILGLFVLPAVVVFCVAMRWLSEAANLLVVARSWHVATVLFVIIYVIPIGTLTCLLAAGFTFDTTIEVTELRDGGWLVLVALPVLFAPWFCLCLSVSRMKSSAEQKQSIVLARPATFTHRPA